MSAELNCLRAALETIRRMDDREPEKGMLESTLRRIIDEKDVSDQVKFAKAQREVSTLRKASLRKAIHDKLRAERIERLAYETDDFNPNALRRVIDMVEESSDPFTVRQAPSAASRQLYYEHKYMQILDQTLSDYFTGGFIGAFVPRPKDTTELSRALLGFETTDPTAARAAETIKRVKKELRDKLRENGVHVEDLPHHREQRLSPARLAANRDRALSEMAQLLDTKRHPDPDITAQAAFDKLMRRHTLEPGERPLTMGRELHYRTDDPDRLHAFLEEFGEDTLLRQVQSTIRRHTRALALAEVFGPDPKPVITTAMRRFQENIATSNMTRAEKVRAETAARGAIHTYDALSGTLDTSQNRFVANVMSGLRTAMIPLYLGRTVFSIVGTDSLIAPLQRGRVEGFGRAFNLQAQGMLGLFNREMRQKLRDYYGTYETIMYMGAPNSRFSNDPVSEGFAAAMQQTSNALYRMTGAWDVEQNLRMATSYSIGRGLGDSRKVPWDELDPRLRQDFESNGLTKRVWDEVNRDGMVDTFGLFMWDNLSNDAQIALGSYFHRTVNHSVLRPDNFTRALLFAGGRRGSLPGELAASVTQFLNWPIQFTRVAQQQQWKKGKPGFAVFSGAVFAGAMVTEQLYALTAGDPAYEWYSTTLLEKALRRSGILTVPGEWIWGAFSGNQFMRPGLGPVYDTTIKIMEQTGRMGKDIYDKEVDKLPLDAARLGRTVTPNMWWFEQTILSPAMRSFEESLDPDSVRRRERRYVDEKRVGF